MPHRGRRRGGARRGESGFTLVELILVVVIVGALAAVVWPQLARFSRTLAVRAAARDLVGVMVRARLEALGRREPVEVRFGASSVTVVRPQVRFAESEASSRIGSAASVSAGGALGSLEEGSGEVTVLEYPLAKSVAWSRLQVLRAKRELIPQEEDMGWGQAPAAAPSEEEVVVTFYPDGTSDDALIGLGERFDGGTYVESQAPDANRSGLTASSEAATEYVVRVRGLVARAVLLRSVDVSDEQYFATVPDVLPAAAN